MTKQSFVLRSLIFAKQLIALRRHCSRPTSRRTISSLSTERYPAFIYNDERNYGRRYTDFAAVICLFSNKKKQSFSLSTLDVGQMSLSCVSAGNSSVIRGSQCRQEIIIPVAILNATCFACFRYTKLLPSTHCLRARISFILTFFPPKLASLLLDCLPNKLFLFLTSESKYYIV